LLGEQPDEVLLQLSSLPSATGRFERIISPQGITAIVDYAHTPDALQNVLETIADLRTGNEQVITIVGCGGNRDKTKRPLMASVACQFSDKVILTSDNPRNEEPEDILAEMQTGVGPSHFRRSQTIIDRRQAIEKACAMAQSGDIILVAGKGHETYQEIKGVKHPFDDKKIVEELLLGKNFTK
jgi:UDP-N-acetylmuramoyl-L-alanyl-D-glutamate--2,6-diaminopimelate ligase